MPRAGDRTTLLVLTWFTFAFFVLLTLVRFLEGGAQCCGGSRKHAAHAQQPPVVVVQQPPPGAYPAYPPPAGQFMTAGHDDIKV